MNIIGRYRELAVFDEVMSSSVAEFLALYGRRRIGKTFLVQQYFRDKGLFFELVGRHKASQKLQLRHFTEVYTEAFSLSSSERLPPPANWDDAFDTLKQQIERSTCPRIILFFDELPWLSSPKSGFLEALDYFWNRYASRNPKIILIVCGSAAAWMIKKVMANKSGLHNRLTRPPLRLLPFTLGETRAYLQARGVMLEKQQLIDLYMVIGGVAYYLNLVPCAKSCAEVVNALFFQQGAVLKSEFHQLYASLYENPKRHISIIKALASTHQGLTQDQIVKKVTSLSSGGGLLTLLEELECCGFIMKLPQFGKKKKEARYRLIDPYTLFFLQWVDGVDEVGEAYWLRKVGSAAYASWLGYAFENLCIQHYREIIEALKLSVVAEAKSSWCYQGSDQEQGAQIDLIVDRADHCINLCEIKYSQSTFVVSKEYAETLKRKKLIFQEKSKTNKSLFTTLISPYGAERTSNYLSAVHVSLSVESLLKDSSRD